ncbi:peptidoglycan recognition protein family protein [Salibacterium aidingense]|uniref:peptidoglycan recognition protein family protein n=1 Tax=Salibacterium aidingense TaxID=384933 RepID=UPI003BE479E2
MNIQDYGLSFGSLKPISKNNIKRVVIHHFGTGKGYTIKDAHRDHSSSSRNHAGITEGLGYNGAVDIDGTKVKGRMWNQGAHCRGYNRDSFGVVTPGNFNEETPSEKVLQSMAEFTAFVLTECGLEVNKKTVVGHRDLGSTSCPGDNFDMDAFRDRVKKVINGEEEEEEMFEPSYRSLREDTIDLLEKWSSDEQRNPINKEYAEKVKKGEATNSDVIAALFSAIKRGDIL